jgi:hypothetical protein
MVAEESIASAQQKEEVEQRVVGNSFETLREEWLCAKKKGKKTGRTAGVPQFPDDNVREKSIDLQIIMLAKK